MNDKVPTYTRWNPPGLVSLSYREATYATALQRMKTYLTTRQDLLRGLPLSLDIYDTRSWADALLESWAMVIDVLTFYQERIANEGYLGTAVETRSIMELAAAVGYQMQSAVAASTFLAFTVLDSQNQPSPRYVIPRGVAVQSVPGPGGNGTASGVAQVSGSTQLPQVFETTSDLLARPAWNAIKPAPPTGVEPRPVYPGDASLRLAGIRTGLKSGDPLLIVGSGQTPQSRGWIFASLASVTPNLKAGYTEVSWGNDVDSGGQTPIANPTAYSLQRQASLYGYTRGGLYYTPLDTPNCSPSAIGLPNTGVHALLRHPSGTLFVGTDSGVFRSSNDGETWEAASSGLLRTKISALTVGGDGKLYAGTTTGGVFYSLDVGNNWYMVIRKSALPNGLSTFFTEPSPANTLPKTEIHALTTFTQNNTAYLAAAMDSGVYLSQDGGLNWQQPPADVVPGVMASIFAVSPQGVPFVGTNTGVYAVAMSSPHTFLFRHQPQTHPLPQIPVRALAVAADNTLIAANAQGIFRSQDNAQNWTAVANSPTGVQALLTTSSGLFAAQGDSILRSRDGGAMWDTFARNIPLGGVSSLLAAANGLFIAGTPDSTSTETGWSRFQVQRGYLDLDKIYPALRKDSWLVLRQENSAALFSVTGAVAKPNDDYRKNKEFTRLTVDNAAQLASFDRSSAAVFTLGQPLPLFNFTPVQGQSLVCAPSGADLAPGQRVFVSGKRVRVRPAAHLTQQTTLASLDGGQHMQLAEESVFILMVRPTTPSGASSNLLLWTLQDANGNTWELTARPDSFNYELAADGDDVVSELVTILSVTPGPSITLTLTSPLQNIYDPATVSLCANVVAASHGQTVQGEVLGSVDQRSESRHFMLKYSPLTYLPSTGGSHPISTLSVAVNGAPWQETNSFFGQNGEQRVYVVRRDSQDNTTVIFGNGRQGAHLPVGREHVTASYRYGSGSAGNLPANSLITTRTRPYGVQKVTNPLPASGGADAEPPGLARNRAPILIQTLQRIVSLTDYEAFARVFPGISKARAQSLWHGGARLVHLTVASDNGAALSTDTYNVLRTAINGVTAAPAQPLAIQSFAPLEFRVGATVIIAAGYENNANTIVENVRHQLLSAFSFEQRTFGQSVSSSEIIALVQSVEGVRAVELTFLSTNHTRQYHPVLHASLARLDGQQMKPAQLLLIDTSDEGIDLQWKGQNS